LIARRTVLALGLAQLVSWGITYYLVGGFGDAIATDLRSASRRRGCARWCSGGASIR
jgi:hypothetical protein